MTAALDSRTLPNISHLRGSIMVLGTGVVFSFGALAFRATDDIGPWHYLVFRGIGAAAVTLVVFTLRNRGCVRETLGAVRPAHVLAGVLLGTTMSAFIVSLTLTSTAFVLFMQTVSPVTAAFFSWMVMKERMAREVWIALAITLVGVGIMVGGSLGTDLGWGVLVVMWIPLAFGLYATLVRSASSIDASVPVIIASITVIVLGGFASIGAASPSVRDALIGVFAGSVLLGSALPVFNIAQRVVPAPETSLLLMSEVVLAPLWVWMWPGERPEGATIVGGLVILVAVVWLTSTRRPARRGRRVLTSRG